MCRFLFSIFVLFSFSISVKANDSTSFLSKIYLPCNWGYINTTSKEVSSGFLFKTGIEYRFNPKTGSFIQLNIDSHSNKYNIKNNQLTNVNDGVLRYNDYTIGYGYRLGTKKLRGYALLQAGNSFVKYPVIIENQTRINVNEMEKSMLILKPTMGLEYYIVENFSFALDLGYSVIPKNMDLWGKQCQLLSISLGINTKLF